MRSIASSSSSLPSGHVCDLIWLPPNIPANSSKGFDGIIYSNWAYFVTGPRVFSFFTMTAGRGARQKIKKGPGLFSMQMETAKSEHTELVTRELRTFPSEEVATSCSLSYPLEEADANDDRINSGTLAGTPRGNNSLGKKFKRGSLSLSLSPCLPIIIFLSWREDCADSTDYKRCLIYASHVLFFPFFFSSLIPLQNLA